MKHSLLAIALLSVVLVACDRDSAGDTPTDTNAGSPAADQPAADVPPATAPMPPVDSGSPATSDARFDGYGDLRFGMTADEAKKVWGGELNGIPAEGETCYHLSPKWVKTQAEFAFMIENDKFVRYSTDSGKLVAPGGGKVDMTADQIGQIYSGRVEKQSHKYVDAASYLRIKDSAGNGVLVFETDEAGKVTQWRVGVPPQVDYVEGCS